MTETGGDPRGRPPLRHTVSSLTVVPSSADHQYCIGL